MRPEPGTRNAASNGSFPIWSCCGRGLPSGAALTNTRWALTPPFHPYRKNRRFVFCCAFLPAAYSPQYPSFSKGLPALCSPDFPPGFPQATARAVIHRCNIIAKPRLCKTIRVLFRKYFLSGKIFLLNGSGKNGASTWIRVRKGHQATSPAWHLPRGMRLSAPGSVGHGSGIPGQRNRSETALRP